MNAKEKATVSIETTIEATIEEVWQAWTDPTCVRQWFGSDPNGKVLSANLDVRPGGHFEVTFLDSDGTEHTCSGKYDSVKRFSRLSSSWMWKSEPGVVSFINISLIPFDTGTRMIFIHSNLGNESKHDYFIGWQSTFSKLKKLLEQKQ